MEQVPFSISHDDSSPQPPSGKGGNRWLLFGLIILLVAVVLGLAAARKPGPKQGTTSDRLPKGYTFTTTDAGNYPSGFPVDLIAQQQVAPIRGQDVTDGSGVNMKIVEYVSPVDIQGTIEAYQNYLKGKGWTLVEQHSNEEMRVMAFQKTGTNTALQIIAFNNAQQQPQVKVTYSVYPSQK